MQLIFFVPQNEELEGTLHPQKFGCTPKNEGKRVHVPPDEKNLWACCWSWRHEQGKHADLLKLNNEISKNALILISCHQALHRNTLR